MPEPGRVLPFPNRRFSQALSSEAIREAARDYVGSTPDSRDAIDLSNGDVLFAICKALRDSIETSPDTTVREASDLFQRIAGTELKVGLFDERDYLLGETAIIAAKGNRLLGRFDEAETWIDRADARFRHIVNPAPVLACVAFERLALRFATGRFDAILELLPSVCLSFRKLEMDLEFRKCQFLEAMTLRAIGRVQESFSVLRRLEESNTVRQEPSLFGQVLVHIGNHLASHGEFASATETYERALPVVLKGGRPVALGELKWAIGDAYRSQGSPGRALEAYRAAISDYKQIGFSALMTHLHLVIAETLLVLNREREAEWEILAALPIIDEQKMVPEGFAAMALLKESIRRRKTDPNALRELREHLKAKA